MDVIIDNAESRQGLVEHEKSPTVESAQMSTVDAEVNPDAKSSTVDDTSKPSSSGANEEDESRNILLHLPQAELRLLCSLLACERYTTFISVLLLMFVLLILGYVISCCPSSNDPKLLIFALATSLALL